MTASLRLNPSSRLFGALVLVVVAALAAAAWFAVVAPKRAEVTKLDTQIASAQLQLVAAQRAGSVKPDTAQNAQIQSLSAAMPDSLAMPQVVLQLNRLAAQAGVTLNTVTPAATVPATGYDTVPITVVVQGGFFSIKAFLAAVRTQVRVDSKGVKATGRLFDVQSVDLEQTEPAPQVTATLALDAFVFAAAPPVSATTTTTTTTTTTPAPAGATAAGSVGG